LAQVMRKKRLRVGDKELKKEIFYTGQTGHPWEKGIDSIVTQTRFTNS
jgi:hypothetical protein